MVCVLDTCSDSAHVNPSGLICCDNAGNPVLAYLELSFIFSICKHMLECATFNENGEWPRILNVS